MIRVCTIANRIHGRHQECYLAYERSLARNKVPYFIHVEGRPWSWKRKVEWELGMARQHPDDYFVFTDAFDYLFVGDLEETRIILESCDLLIPADAGEKPWPQPELAPFYDARRIAISPWRWVNGAGPAGKGSAIAEAIQYGLSHYPFREPPETDQNFWTHVYLDGYGVLDQYCSLTQVLHDSPEGSLTISRDGRLINNITGSRPQFLHATGHSWHAIPESLIPPEEEFKP